MIQGNNLTKLHSKYLRSIKLEAVIHKFSVVRKNFAKLKGKQCRGLFSIMLQPYSLQLYLTKRPTQVLFFFLQQAFAEHFFSKLFQNKLLQNTSGRMLLDLRKFAEYFRKILMKPTCWGQVFVNVKGFCL